MNLTKGSIGWIEVVCGPMFSGKSEELIRRLRRAEIARQRVQIFKPGIDQRYANDHIVSHSELKIQSEGGKDWQELEKKLDWRTEVIGIDEAQFLGDGIVDLVVRLADIQRRQDRALQRPVGTGHPSRSAEDPRLAGRRVPADGDRA